MEKVKEKIVFIISDLTNTSVHDINSGTDTDLEIDSLKLVEILTAMEETFKIKLDFEDMLGVEKMEDLVDVVLRKLGTNPQ
jgi:acyl carrier protein